MSTLRLEVVTQERVVFEGDVEMVIAPGVEGELGILPRHAPLMTALTTGILRAKRGEEEIVMAVSGGFMEVQPDRVVVMADTAERAEEIDVARAEAARRRAEARLRSRQERVDFARAEAALRRAMVRLKVAEYRKRRHRRRREESS
ncbi:MAG: F0F1 ATP synthase subunit epsilon [Chloroflexi bacterium]|nr:MAG: F0F1 ATP synthase subunit epsilon [Chloroflexota bacterium]